jgi:hypothetical protein
VYGLSQSENSEFLHMSTSIPEIPIAEKKTKRAGKEQVYFSLSPFLSFPLRYCECVRECVGVCVCADLSIEVSDQYVTCGKH